MGRHSDAQLTFAYDGEALAGDLLILGSAVASQSDVHGLRRGMRLRSRANEEATYRIVKRGDSAGEWVVRSELGGWRRPMTEEEIGIRMIETREDVDGSETTGNLDVARRAGSRTGVRSRSARVESTASAVRTPPRANRATARHR